MAEARRLTTLARDVGRVAQIPAGSAVVALSGGADSAALLWITARVSESVRAVHVHHGLAGSDLMMGAAEDVASALGIPLTVRRVVVAPGASPEAQARAARYQALLGELAPDETLLTAHTSDDQAETVLHHLLRGTGPDGLAGIPRRRGPIVRPFLEVTRAQTRELATLAGLGWIDDPANDDPDVLRNTIRRRLIPELEAGFNPRLRRVLAETARSLSADVAYLDTVAADQPLDGVAGPELAASSLTTADGAVGARIARRLLAAAGVGSVTAGAVAAVMEVAQGTAARHDVGSGVVVRRRGAMVVASRDVDEPEPVSLSVPGSARFGPWWFDTETVGGPPSAMPLGAHWMVGDADVLDDLRVEPCAGRPDLMEQLASAGVPAEDRPPHPVVVTAEGPVWLPGVRRLSLGWVHAATERYLVARTRVDRSWLRSER